MSRIWTGFLAIFVLLAVGCASTPQATPERDAQAKQFTTHPDAGTIYVYRSETDRLDDETVLFIDGRIVGQTLPGTYFRIDTVPGRRILHGVGVDTGKIEVNARPGALYFVELYVIEARSHYRLVDERVGRQRIAKCCVMLEAWAPGQRPLIR